MKPILLEFNISDDKNKKLEKICRELGIEILKVNKADFSQTLGAVLGVLERKNEICFAPFSDEMLVMVGMSEQVLDSFLASMRTLKVSVPLKAMLTQVNLNWQCGELCSELRREHQAVMKRVVK